MNTGESRDRPGLREAGGEGSGRTESAMNLVPASRSRESANSVTVVGQWCDREDSNLRPREDEPNKLLLPETRAGRDHSSRVRWGGQRSGRTSPHRRVGIDYRRVARSPWAPSIRLVQRWSKMLGLPRYGFTATRIPSRSMRRSRWARVARSSRTRTTAIERVHEAQDRVGTELRAMMDTETSESTFPRRG